MVLVPASWLVLQHVDTMAHEGTHALVGSAMGGRVSYVRVKLDGNGATGVSTAGLGGVFTGAGGYLGSSAFGLAAAKLISIGHIVAVLWLTLFLLALLLLMIRNPFGVLVIAAMGIVLSAVALRAGTRRQPAGLTGHRGGSRRPSAPRRNRQAGYGRAADLFRLTSRPLEGAG